MTVLEKGLTTLLQPRPLSNFVETPFIKNIVERSLIYIHSGFSIHFRGSAGTGKTTLAMHVASKLERPVVLIHGDEEFSTSDLVGGEYGYCTRKVIDNYIHSVLKTEEDISRKWLDNRLTVACQYGFTLIYDEFTRSRPEANNVLLAVLQERMLDLPTARGGENYLRVHPQFTTIFTSNPEEYAGIYRGQDALLDRMISLDLDTFDEETEIAIIQAKSGIDQPAAVQITRLLSGLRTGRGGEFPPSIRGGIMLARALQNVKSRNGGGGLTDELFRQMCLDILTSCCARGIKTPHFRQIREELNQRMNHLLQGDEKGGGHETCNQGT